MVGIISFIIVIASILLVLVVYIQNPKGGGLSTDFGAAHQLGGVQKTNDFVDKATWTLAGVIGVLSVVLTLKMKSPEPVAPTTEETQTEQPNQSNGQGQGQNQGQKQPR